MQRRKICLMLVVMLALVLCGWMQTDYVRDAWDFGFGLCSWILMMIPIFGADLEIGSGSGPAA